MNVVERPDPEPVERRDLRRNFRRAFLQLGVGQLMIALPAGRDLRRGVAQRGVELRFLDRVRPAHIDQMKPVLRRESRQVHQFAGVFRAEALDAGVTGVTHDLHHAPFLSSTTSFGQPHKCAAILNMTISLTRGMNRQGVFPI